MVGLLAGFGIFQYTVFLVALRNLVEQGCLCLGIGGTKLFCALEHKVLQIVGQAGGLCGVVLRSRTHSDVGLYAGLLCIHAQIHLQAIVESVDAGVHLVPVYCLILVVFCLGTHTEQQTGS